MLRTQAESVFRLTALEVASTVAGVGALGFVTKVYFDSRDALWKRAQWAMDEASSAQSDLERKVGLQAMTELLRERRLRTKDVRLMRAVMLTIAEDARRELNRHDDSVDDQESSDEEGATS